jgi:hypothetical protein
MVFELFMFGPARLPSGLRMFSCLCHFVDLFVRLFRLHRNYR